MPVKIRLQRRGRKFSKIYSIVVADSRAPRDGRYIETLGQYDPNTNPATIEIDFDKSLEWLQKGAQPTDTCRAILSYKGVLYKKHLLEGVKKGAFDEAEAEKRFEKWMKDKESKIQAKVDKLASDKESSKKERMAAEVKIKEERALEIEKQRSEMIKKEAAEAAGEEATEEAAEETAEAAAETPGAEAETTEAAEEVAEETAEATEAEAETTEAPVEEAREEAPAEEVKEEAPAEAPKAEEARDEAKEDEADSKEEKK
jgi:small subunit ribosomal protein S16